MNIKKAFSIIGIFFVVIVSSVLIIYQFNVNENNYLKNKNIALSKKIKENEIKIDNINKNIIEVKNEKEIKKAGLDKIKKETNENKEVAPMDIKQNVLLNDSSENPEDILFNIIKKTFPLLIIPLIFIFIRNSIW
jgi:CxxC motif-containing protein